MSVISATSDYAVHIDQDECGDVLAFVTFLDDDNQWSWVADTSWDHRPTHLEVMRWAACALTRHLAASRTILAST